MSKADMLAGALDDFLAVSPDVEAAAVVSADGLPMASALPPYVEEDRLAAMSAALLTLGERAAAGLGKGDLAQVFVEGAQGYVVLMSAGANAVLVAVTSKDTKVGLILYEMRKTSARIGEVMDSTPVAQEQAHAALERATTAVSAPPIPAPEPVVATQPPAAEYWSQTPVAPEEPATEQPATDGWEVASVVHEESSAPVPASDDSWSDSLMGDEPLAPEHTEHSEQFAPEPAEQRVAPPAPPADEPVAPPVPQPESGAQEGDWKEEQPEKETRVTGWH